VSNVAGTKALSAAEERWFHIIQGGYLVFIFALFMFLGIGITPELLFLLLVAGFAIRSRKAFIRDFAPFVLLLLSYDAMRGFADNLNGHVYIDYPIKIDEAIFGEVPTVVLQRWLFHGHAGWLEYAAAMLHIVHFFVPLLFGAIIWQHKHEQYWKFVTSLVVLSYAAFITFMLVPTAPPWYASVHGHLEGVQLVHNTLPALSAAYTLLSPNEVAAMPSLHSAYPTLFFLFAVRLWGKKALPVGLYPVAVWFAVMYMGHHYFIDVFMGAVYACLTYVVVATSLVSSRVRAVVEKLRGSRRFELAPLPVESEQQAA
jgi:hypothetical protein